MTKPKSQQVQPARPTTSLLANDFEISIAGGIWCPECGDNIRACDAEALDDGAMRLVCKCGHLVLHYRPRT
jgi:hypothetical protein